MSQMDNQLAIQLGKLLLLKGWMVGTAESCTGGRIAAMLTAVSGSSVYFSGGVVAYSNEVKQQVLGVSPDDLTFYGAVSRQVVEQMAQGATRILGCDCSIAVSGIAGPTGGTADKPVGTVWIAVAINGVVNSVLCHFDGDREAVTHQSAVVALQLLIDALSRGFVNE